MTEAKKVASFSFKVEEEVQRAKRKEIPPFTVELPNSETITMLDPRDMDAIELQESLRPEKGIQYLFLIATSEEDFEKLTANKLPVELTNSMVQAWFRHYGINPNEVGLGGRRA